jgi:hypothetical protein
MVLVKILGGIDLAAAFAYLMITFGFHIPLQFILFCAGLLFAKGLFIFRGDVLSILDLLAAFFLLLSIVFTLPAIMLWIPAFFLLAKGVVSFI